MNERTMRLQIGLFVLAALALLGTLVVLFGSLPRLFRRSNTFTVRFTDAPGIAPGTPVRRSGVRIGEVREVVLDDERGIVRVKLAIDPRYGPRQNEQATLVTGVLGGDASIDFVPQAEEGGQPADRSPLPPGSEVVGARAATVNTLLNRASEVVPTTQETLNDIRKSMQRLERMAQPAEDTMREYRELARAARESIPDLRRTNNEYYQLAREARRTNEDIGATVRNWGRLGERLDVLLQANQDKLVKALDNLNEVLTRIGNVVNDENQRNLAAILRNTRSASEPLESISRSADDILKEGRTTVRRLNDALARTNEVLTDLQKTTRPLSERGESIIRNMDESLANANKVTRPLAERATPLTRNLDESLDKLNKTLGDVQALMRAIDQGEGTVRRLLTDPSLYNHLDEAACMLTRLMPRLDRILHDFEIFADKLARHPESIGLGGVVKPGSGLKDPPSAPYYPRGVPGPPPGH
jgi:ABC-type transporter Mla subunit MlaD